MSHIRNLLLWVSLALSLATRPRCLLQTGSMNPGQVSIMQEHPQGPLKPNDEEDVVEGEDPTPVDDVEPDLSDPSFEEESDQATRVNNASLIEGVARLNSEKHPMLAAMVADPGFGSAAGKSAGIMGKFLSTGKWEGSMTKDLAGAAWAGASAFVGLSCPPCGLIMGMTWGFFEGLFGGGEDDTFSALANEIYTEVMKDVKIYVTKEFIRDKLETVNERIYNLRQSMQWFLSAKKLSFDVRRSYLKDIVKAAGELSFSIRHTRHLSENQFCLSIGPILHTVQAMEMWSYALHEWMLQGESFGDELQPGEKLRSINRKLLQLMKSDPQNYDKVWGAILPKALVAMRDDVRRQTNFHELNGHPHYQNSHCKVSFQPEDPRYHGSSLREVTGCAPGRTDSAHGLANWIICKSSEMEAHCITTKTLHCQRVCPLYCRTRSHICSNVHFDKWVETLFTHFRAYQRNQYMLEGLVAVGSVVDKQIVASPSSDNLQCNSGRRVFHLRSHEADEWKCKGECSTNPNCISYSGIFGKWCIGCSEPWLDTPSQGAKAFIVERYQKMIPKPSMDNLKCHMYRGGRVFVFRSHEADERKCLEECTTNSNCVAYSGVFGQWCIGCSHPLDEKQEGAKAFIAQAYDMSGIASQSSTYENLKAYRGNDGNEHTYVRTVEDSDPWWQLDFGRRISVISIKILNRKGYGVWRLFLPVTATFGVSDTPCAGDVCPGQVCGQLTKQNANGSNEYDISCGKIGRYVYVQLPGHRRTLNFYEMVVSGF